jgi:hypothetical protein
MSMESESFMKRTARSTMRIIKKILLLALITWYRGLGLYVLGCL